MQGNSSFQQNTQAFYRPEKDLEIQNLKKQLEEAKKQNEILKHALEEKDLKLEERDLEIQILQNQALTYRPLDAIVGIANQSNASIEVRLEEARVIAMLVKIDENNRQLPMNTIAVVNKLKSKAEAIMEGKGFLEAEKHCKKIINAYLINEINNIADDNFRKK